MSGTSPMMTKEEAVTRVSAMERDKRSQQAIVKLMSGEGRIQKIVHVIPGGIHLVDQLDADNLRTAVFTWLRRERDFERYEISFIGDYDTEDDLKDKGIRLKKVKVIDFGWKAGAPLYWRKKGIAELANLITTILSDTEDLVSVIIEREGIFVITDTKDPPFGPSSENWCPSLLIHKQRT